MSPSFSRSAVVVAPGDPGDPTGAATATSAPATATSAPALLRVGAGWCPR